MKPEFLSAFAIAPGNICSKADSQEATVLIGLNNAVKTEFAAIMLAVKHGKSQLLNIVCKFYLIWIYM